MIKRILKIWFIIGMYELSKYLTNELIVKLQSEDDVDTAPKDYVAMKEIGEGVSKGIEIEVSRIKEGAKKVDENSESDFALNGDQADLNGVSK
ncbi:transcriptional activator RinB [Staphylococcus haemolyticus]|uniref:transcriptional activator RinB n=1 Tax=Staphylococcus haemolyticus TaxID=1283 RepID=UPI00069F632F